MPQKTSIKIAVDTAEKQVVFEGINACLKID